ncbi:MAG TPA: hypothetical protein VGR08_03565 [Thermomicrobiales bacterium]|nr:hypothetical protein [Thermomicrobiales bacterium]
MNGITRDLHDPAGDQDFRQFASAFDRPLASAPSFAAALKRQVTQPATAVPTALPSKSGPLTAARPVHISSVERSRRRIGFTVLEIAAALLLISTLAASAYVINSVGRPIGPDGGNGPGRLAQGIAHRKPHGRRKRGGDARRDQLGRR